MRIRFPITVMRLDSSGHSLSEYRSDLSLMERSQVLAAYFVNFQALWLLGSSTYTVCRLQCTGQSVRPYSEATAVVVALGQISDPCSA